MSRILAESALQEPLPQNDSRSINTTSPKLSPEDQELEDLMQETLDDDILKDLGVYEEMDDDEADFTDIEIEEIDD